MRWEGDEESREFWAGVDRVAEEVSQWPECKRAAAMVAIRPSSNDHTRQALAERDRSMTPRERMIQCLEIGLATQEWVDRNKPTNDDSANDGGER